MRLMARLRPEQIGPSGHAMLDSGLLARDASLSGLGVRAGMTQQETAFSARHGRRDQLADKCGFPVREASRSP